MVVDNAPLTQDSRFVTGLLESKERRMEVPNVPFTIRDRHRNITWVIWAYRQLDKEEALRMLAVLLRSSKKRPKPNSRYDILTVIQ